MLEYRITNDVPSIEHYLRLRPLQVEHQEPQSAELGLPNSILGVTVPHGDQTVGMDRVVGGGGLFFQVTTATRICWPPSPCFKGP